jgi:hypothetical protein
MISLIVWFAAVDEGASGLVHLLLAMPMFTLSVVLFELILGPYRIDGPEENEHAASRWPDRADRKAHLRVVGGRASSVDQGTDRLDSGTGWM